MTIKTYTYTVSGTAADGQTWETVGTIACEFVDVWHHAMRCSFEDLTKGEAVYGQPGVGCQGPYDIDKIVIEQVK
jgi:hypothetical protein